MIIHLLLVGRFVCHNFIKKTGMLFQGLVSEHCLSSGKVRGCRWKLQRSSQICRRAQGKSLPDIWRFLEFKNLCSLHSMGLKLLIYAFSIPTNATLYNPYTYIIIFYWQIILEYYCPKWCFVVSGSHQNGHSTKTSHGPQPFWTPGCWPQHSTNSQVEKF